MQWEAASIHCAQERSRSGFNRRLGKEPAIAAFESKPVAVLVAIATSASIPLPGTCDLVRTLFVP